MDMNINFHEKTSTLNKHKVPPMDSTAISCVRTWRGRIPGRWMQHRQSVFVSLAFLRGTSPGCKLPGRTPHQWTGGQENKNEGSQTQQLSHQYHLREEGGGGGRQVARQGFMQWNAKANINLQHYTLGIGQGIGNVSDIGGHCLGYTTNLRSVGRMSLTGSGLTGSLFSILLFPCNSKDENKESKIAHIRISRPCNCSAHSFNSFHTQKFRMDCT